ncbi:hypothetical protein COCVIDRAFT_98727 [Bipolaris victoriae FI3]|uniref:Uncharacterized protein n=1 Tax=Bipolaris victoriae (strain FI3) TaxID=930091 RepID=W7EK73_BIPV3|nr:hypothetical protein COCVIDRAFT_98727 [Bipolaris victoriae FI3]
MRGYYTLDTRIVGPASVDSGGRLYPADPHPGLPLLALGSLRHCRNKLIDRQVYLSGGSECGGLTMAIFIYNDCA